jgi:hypothetical protein
MLILKDPPQLDSITDPDLLKLTTLRLTQLTPTLPHQMIIVEPGDTVEDLETITGCPILNNLFDDTRYPDPDFVPCCEVLEDHGCCYEMVFIFSDGDDSVSLFIPKTDVDEELLSMCAQYAVSVNST